MRGLHALRAERGQLLLTASAHASAYPPGGFYDIGKHKLSYIIITKKGTVVTVPFRFYLFIFIPKQHPKSS